MADRPTTAGGSGRRPRTGAARPGTSAAAARRPMTGAVPAMRPFSEPANIQERDELDDDDDDDDFDLDGDDDEGMFSFGVPDSEPPATAAGLSIAGVQDQAMLQQLAMQQMEAIQAAQQQRALESAAGVPKPQQTVVPTFVSPSELVASQSGGAALEPPAPVPASAPTTAASLDTSSMSPAAAIAAKYIHKSHKNPKLSSSQANGSPSSRDRSRMTPTISEKAAPIVELADGLRAAGWTGSGRGSHGQTAVEGRSLASDGSRVSRKYGDDGGYRVAAGGIGAHLEKTPKIGHASPQTDDDLESNLGGKGDEKDHHDQHAFRGVSGRLSPVDALELQDFAMDEEDSPYLEVRASVSNVDDPEMPCLTFRAWVIGLTFAIVCGALNLFFTLRYPSPYIYPLVIQIISYPAGKILAYILPDHVFTVPGGPEAPSRSGFMGFCNKWWPTWLGAGQEWNLNPGPFNIKEHCVISMMANAAVGPVYAFNATLVMDKYYLDPPPLGFDFVLALSSQCIGFALAGLTRRFLVRPASMIWPNNLVSCTLLNTFHAEDDDGSDGSITRYRFFCYVASGAFIWYFVPGFLFRALSWFSWMCWILPTNRVVNQLFGVNTGLGMGLITFDWAQIAYIGSPLVVPWWAMVNGFLGFVFFFWLLGPILYYTNVWSQAYLPIGGYTVYDRYGLPYNTSAIVDVATQSLNVTAYQEYSPLFLPMTFTGVYSLAFALSSAVIIHTLLYHGPEIWAKLKQMSHEEEDVHAKLMKAYAEVPDWWYWVYLIVFVILAVVAVEVYHTGLPIWALMMSIAIAVIYILPAGFIFAMTSQQLSPNLVAEVIPGYLLEGKPFANMLFKTYCVQSLSAGLNFVQDQKLGHYMKVPPRTTFICQVVAAVLSALVQIAVKALVVAIVPDLCELDQPSGLSCPYVGTMYSASIIWGLLGPARQFGVHTLYRPIVYWAIIGIFLPIPGFLLARRFPKKTWMQHINIPVLLNGASAVPPATGINYASWMIVGSIFQCFLKRKRLRWWSKFNFITSAGMDTGTVLCTIFIFLVLQLPKNGTIAINWWGNTVFTKTDDWNEVPYLDPPPEGFGPTSW